MAARIRGITIELSGDTSGLTKALASAERAAESTQKALKDVNKALKLDPTSTDLLAQKQKLLKEAVTKTEAQLKQEEKALKALQDAPDSDKTIPQQEALQRQIAVTKTRLKEAKAEFNSFGSVGAQKVAAIGEKLAAVGQKVAELGTALTQKVSAPIAAIGAASVITFNDVDKGYDRIIKKTGATGTALEGMQKTLKNIAAKVPSDFDTIGAAIGEVNTRFGLTGDELESLSTQFLMFAQLNEQDVSTAVDAAQKALAAFGLDAASAGTYLDTVNLVAQQTGINVATLQNGVVSNAAAFQELGLSLGQATTLIGQFELSGVSADTAMAGLTRALKNATEQGIPLDEALNNLQATITEGTDSADGLTAAYDLFGKSGAQIFAAVQNGTIDFNNLNAAVTDAGGNITTTFEATQDPTDKFTVALQGLKLAGSELGSTLLTFLEPAIQKVTEIVTTLREKWEKLSPEAQNTIIKVGLIVAALGPVVLVVGKVIGLIGGIMSAIPALLGVLGTIFSPVGAIVAAIAAVIAIGVLLYKNWDEIKAKAVEIWTKIKDWFSKTVGAIRDRIVAVWEAVRQYFINLWTAIRDRIVNTWSAIRDWFSRTTGAIRDRIVAVWEAVRQYFINLWTAIRDRIVNVWTSIKTWMSSLWDGIKSKATSVWNSVKEAITKPIESAKEKVKSAIDKIKSFFKFDWSLPKLKMPHISITGEFSLIPPSVPHFSIEWYKKAANAGAIFSSPTIFGMQNGKLLGAGDASQPEALIGTRSLQNMIQSAVGGGLSVEAIYEAVQSGASNAQITVYMDGRDVTAAVNRHNTAQQLGNLKFRGV